MCRLSRQESYTIINKLGQATPLVTRVAASPDRVGLGKDLVSFDFTLIGSNELNPQLRLQLWQQNLDEQGERFLTA